MLFLAMLPHLLLAAPSKRQTSTAVHEAAKAVRQAQYDYDNAVTLETVLAVRRDEGKLSISHSFRFFGYYFRFRDLRLI